MRYAEITVASRDCKLISDIARNLVDCYGDDSQLKLWVNIWTGEKGSEKDYVKEAMELKKKHET